MILLFLILAGIPLEPQPSWESQPGFYSTGGGFADFNGDGWPDLAVANGNDMAAEPNHLYPNENGSLNPQPSWISEDLRYSGHLAVGDVNNDGWPDLAVANYARAYVWQPEYSAVYLNQGGTLQPDPAWQPQEAFISFACALGDFDLDGDLDLAFACGEAYSHQPDVQRLYRNLTAEGEPGLFTPEPVWTTLEPYYGYDVAFADVNRDGWPDLVFACSQQPNLVFLNQGGTFDDEPSWLSDDTWGTLQIDLGDVNNDGWPDLVTADNGQTGGSSRFRLYLNQGGVFQSFANWTSAEDRNYCSTVALADVDGDGWLDLAAGGWWEPVAVYQNLQGSLEATASWAWQPSNSMHLVCEKVTLFPVHHLAGDLQVDTLYPLDTGTARGWFWLHRRPVARVDSVRMVLSQGETLLLPPTAYHLDPELGALTVIPPEPESLVARYEVFYPWIPPDLVVTNWEETRGNFGFLNLQEEVQEAPVSSASPLRVWPHPVVGRVFHVGGPRELVSLRLWNLAGRRVPVQVFPTAEGNLRVILPAETPSGVYFLEAKDSAGHRWRQTLVRWARGALP